MYQHPAEPLKSRISVACEYVMTSSSGWSLPLLVRFLRFVVNIRQSAVRFVLSAPAYKAVTANILQKQFLLVHTHQLQLNVSKK